MVYNKAESKFHFIYFNILIILFTGTVIILRSRLFVGHCEGVTLGSECSSILFYCILFYFQNFYKQSQGKLFSVCNNIITVTGDALSTFTVITVHFPDYTIIITFY